MAVGEFGNNDNKLLTEFELKLPQLVNFPIRKELTIFRVKTLEIV